jgi:hypothetical protein
MCCSFAYDAAIFDVLIKHSKLHHLSALQVSSDWIEKFPEKCLYWFWLFFPLLLQLRRPNLSLNLAGAVSLFPAAECHGSRIFGLCSSVSVLFPLLWPLGSRFLSLFETWREIFVACFGGFSDRYNEVTCFHTSDKSSKEKMNWMNIAILRSIIEWFYLTNITLNSSRSKFTGMIHYQNSSDDDHLRYFWEWFRGL